MAVNWFDLISANSVTLQKSFQDKAEILEFLAGRLCQNPKLAACPKNVIHNALQEREQQSSTGLGGGIAVPHCGLKQAEGFALEIITLSDGVDFGAFDALPCNLIIAIVGPASERSQHVQILASLASGLQKVEELDALLRCTEPNRAMEILGRMFGEDFPKTPPQNEENPKENPSETLRHAESKKSKENHATHQSTKGTEFSRLSIFIQKERLFAQLLEEAVRASSGTLAVIEGHNIAEYLQRMPLYAYFLNAKKINRFFRCIEAIVPNAELGAVYAAVRRIDRNIEQKPGVLVFHQPIQGALGSLEMDAL